MQIAYYMIWKREGSDRPQSFVYNLVGQPTLYYTKLKERTMLVTIKMERARIELSHCTRVHHFQGSIYVRQITGAKVKITQFLEQEVLDIAIEEEFIHGNNTK